MDKCWIWAASPKVAAHKRKTRAACSQNAGIAAWDDKEKGLTFARKPFVCGGASRIRTADLWIMIPFKRVYAHVDKC